MNVLRQTNFAKTFKHITFELHKDESLFYSYTFTINPEEFSQEEPSRSSVIKTLGGAYVEEWGRDLININIKGTTGYGKRYYANGKETDGYQTFKDLRDKIYRYFLEPQGRMKQTQTSKYQLLFFNWEDDEYYEVYPERFILMRSKNKPLLYSYDFSFICIKQIGRQKTSVDTLAIINSLSFNNSNIKRFTNILGVLISGYRS